VMVAYGTTASCGVKVEASARPRLFVTKGGEKIVRRAFGHSDGGLHWEYGRFLRYVQAGRRLANLSVRRSPSLEVMLVEVC
jgi:hypothetical protein